MAKASTLWPCAAKADVLALMNLWSIGTGVPSGPIILVQSEEITSGAPLARTC